MQPFQVSEREIRIKNRGVICKHGKIPQERNPSEEYLTSFLTIPMRFSYILLLSPFYLRLRRNLDSRTGFQEYVAGTWLPQKIFCGVLTFLDSVWMLGMFQENLPENDRNPRQHVRCLIDIISHLFKCVTIKKLWRNQSRIVECTNFIHKLTIPVLRHKKGLPPPQVLIFTIMLSYFVMALFRATDIFHGNIHHPQPDLTTWWQNKIKLARYNFFLGASKNYTGEYMSTENIIIGTMGLAAYVHR